MWPKKICSVERNRSCCHPNSCAVCIGGVLLWPSSRLVPCRSLVYRVGSWSTSSSLVVTKAYVDAPSMYLGVPLVLIFLETPRCYHNTKVFRVYLNSGGERQECSRHSPERGKRVDKDFMWLYPHKRLNRFCGPALEQWRCAKAEAQVSMQFPSVMMHSMLFPNVRLCYSQLLDASPKQPVDSHSS